MLSRPVTEYKSYIAAQRVIGPAMAKLLRSGDHQGREVACSRLSSQPTAGRLNYQVFENSSLMRAVFLRFLDMDIDKHQGRLQPVTVDLLSRIDDLVGGEDIDLDAPLLPEDDD